MPLKKTIYKEVASINGWTVILDSDLCMTEDTDRIRSISEKLNTPVFSMVCESVSGTYGFSYTDQGVHRSYCLEGGTIIEDIGQPIPQERDIKLTELFETDVIGLLSRIGVSSLDIQNHSDFEVWELEYTNPLEENHLHTSLPSSKNPWWKFWKN
ncbi:hypothetical protein ONV78_16720 [Hahella sp. CR1]|uniref:hypothetical protein n=1 Tax=Hahella sp. CR1 TaxID=2992807 RepID=UPI002442289F|nr:hypothetical protein [Hahella sp. CR1]MDG9669386.1 hypothetical protein [Hahella sp. CR1]